MRSINFIQEPPRNSGIGDDIARFRLDTERNAVTLSQFERKVELASQCKPSFWRSVVRVSRPHVRCIARTGAKGHQRYLHEPRGSHDVCEADPVRLSPGDIGVNHVVGSRQRTDS
jgi:hypothetical protein